MNIFRYNFIFSEYEIEGMRYKCSFSKDYYSKFKLFYAVLLDRITANDFDLFINEEAVHRILKVLDDKFKSLFLRSVSANIDGYTNIKRYVVSHIILKLLGIEDFLHILIDPYVNEIFVDGVSKPIYLDHAIFGRLVSQIRLSNEQMKRFLLYTKLRANVLLDFLVSPIRVDVNLYGQKLRISVMPQRTEEGPAINIRKILSVPPYLTFIYDDLARLYLSLMLTLLVLKPNIVIFGETGSGKTTLASLLIHAIPSSWRIALIEDVAEIPPQVVHNKHAMRMKVLSLEEKVAGLRGLRKDIAILEMLHRTPDLCFISEIHDKEDAEAMFHAMASGLRVIATTHARNINSLFERWFSIYNFPYSWLKLIDLIVFVKRVSFRGRIIRIIDSLYVPSMNASLRYPDFQSISATATIAGDIGNITKESTILTINGMSMLSLRLQTREKTEESINLILSMLKMRLEDISFSPIRKDVLAKIFRYISTRLNDMAKVIRSIGTNNPEEISRNIQLKMVEISKIIEKYQHVLLSVSMSKNLL